MHGQTLEAADAAKILASPSTPNWASTTTSILSAKKSQRYASVSEPQPEFVQSPCSRPDLQNIRHTPARLRLHCLGSIYPQEHQPAGTGSTTRSSLYVTGNNDTNSSVTAMLRDLEWPHWSSVVITAAWLWCTTSSIDWSTLILLQASPEPTPILEVTHPESWNTHAVVMLTPAPFTHALHVTGMLYQRTHFSVNQSTHLRTTSALTHHLITVFSNHVILEPWHTLSRCALVFE